MRRVFRLPRQQLHRTGSVGDIWEERRRAAEVQVVEAPQKRTKHNKPNTYETNSKLSVIKRRGEKGLSPPAPGTSMNE